MSRFIKDEKGRSCGTLKYSTESNHGEVVGTVEQHGMYIKVPSEHLVRAYEEKIFHCQELSRIKRAFKYRMMWHRKLRLLFPWKILSSNIQCIHTYVWVNLFYFSVCCINIADVIYSSFWHFICLPLGEAFCTASPLYTILPTFHKQYCQCIYTHARIPIS